MQLRGCRALVTGATGEIGHAVVDRLARQGCRLTLSGRDRTALDRLAERTGARRQAADLLDPGQRQSLVEAVGDGLELAVLAAGVGFRARLIDTSEADLRQVLDLNLVSQLELTRLLVPLLVRGGRLAYIGSIAGRLGVAGESVYAAAKAGLEILADSLRVELSAAGIGVTVVSPGAVGTQFFARRGVPYHRRFPRPVPPERVADALVTGLRRDRDQVFVPRWLRWPVAVHALTPQAYGRAARRWG